MCGSGGVCIQKDGNSPSGVCSCFPGFYGLDCSLRLCPAGNAWVDFPSANNVAHGAFTECSNQGVCDRNLGSCRCRAGFTGPACELLKCPTGASWRGHQEQCSGHGQCVTLREAGARRDYVHFHGADAYSDWDQDMLAGCACEVGWEGSACDLRSCPKGDDPETSGTDEVQLFECTCSTCSGGVRFTFRGDTTLDLPYDASDDLIRYRMLQLATIKDIGVRIAFGTGMCSGGGGSLTEFTFRDPGGALTAMTFSTYGSLAGTLGIKSGGQWSLVLPHLESVTGTREWAECSNRGNCDHKAGVCRCLPGFESSDGRGNLGSRGDCGHRYLSSMSVTTRPAVVFSTVAGVPTAYAQDASPGVVSLSDCPFIPGAGVCANHGTCDGSTNKCICDAGWQGVVCHKKSCGAIKKWVGEVGAGHANTAECGGIGSCNYETGVCECDAYGVFTGASCQALSCPSAGELALECNGTGYCRNLQELAAFAFSEQKKLAGFTYTSPWDAQSIFGCACKRAPSVDNRFHSDYLAATSADERGAAHEAPLYYRGPYARAVTDFWGFDCALRRCPSGDNPATRFDRNEQQKIVCQATAGTFTLTFRENTTLVLNYNDRATVAAYRLEQLFTIRSVKLSYVQTDLQTAAAADSFCSSDSSTVVLVDFLSEFGDLPLLQATDIDLAGAGKAFTVTEVFAGSKEDAECSRQGVCNEYTGVCTCREGFGSSDDTTASVGDRGDCTWRNRLDPGGAQAAM